MGTQVPSQVALLFWDAGAPVDPLGFAAAGCVVCELQDTQKRSRTQDIMADRPWVARASEAWKN